MAITNNARVGKSLDLLRDGLAPFVERELRSRYGSAALDRAQQQVQADRLNVDRPLAQWDAAPLLALMWDAWNDVFRDVLGPAERSFVGELRGVRRKWAHQEPFSGDDARAGSVRMRWESVAPAPSERPRNSRRLTIEALGSGSGNHAVR